MKKIISKKLIITMLVVLDIIVSVLACYCGLVIFESSFTDLHLNNLLYFVIFYPILSITLFFVFRLYNSVWRYASVHEFTSTFIACFIMFGLNFIVCLIFRGLMPLAWTAIVFKIGRAHV